VHRSAEALRDGPLHTLELARSVLGLRGHAGAASAAVFSLLGTDARFEVDGEGNWSLAPGAEALGRPLPELAFAVVDVETTGGGYREGHRITEVAVVEVQGGTIVDEWETLVNPGRSIPRPVERITGISTGMVRSAPWFEHVAPELESRLRGRVFVAHNVGFDWRFVSSELAGAGADVPSMPRLCTVRLSRALVPGLRRRNLDALTRHFGIPVHARHRAYGDALATARVLLRLLDEATGRGIGDLQALRTHVDRRGRRGRKPAAQTELLGGKAAPPGSLQPREP
jgi:DNA polymerase-3 subunit epsilon